MKKHFIKTMLLALLCAVGGVGAAWADEVTVPTPVYFNDFSSTEGLTIHGDGEFIDSEDSHFGKIYHNASDNTTASRTNYLILPSDVLTHSGTTQQMTIGFWVNVGKAAESSQNFWGSPIFSAYESEEKSNTWPMFAAWAGGTMQLNCWGWTNFEGAQNDNEKKENAYDTYWLDDAAWHYYTIVLTGTTGAIYIDGNVKNSWTMDGSDGQYIAGLFNGGAANALPYVCLGGLQPWGGDAVDPAFYFDDFAVYDAALSADQIKQIMANKMADDEEGSNDITNMNVVYDYTTAAALANNVIRPFDKGTVKAGTNVQALTINNTTATAWFDSDAETEGRQAYNIAANEKVNIFINAYHGWLSSGKDITVTLYAPEGKSLASYVYNVVSCNLTDVKIGGETPTDFVAKNFQNGNGLVANGRNPFPASGNPEISISISGSGYVEMTFSKGETVLGSYSATLDKESYASLEKITITNPNTNDDRAYHIGKLTISTEETSDAMVTYKFEDTNGNSLADLKADLTAPGTIGKAIAEIIPEGYKNSFFNGDETVKYVYDSFTCSDETLPAAGTTVILKFAANTKFTYNVNAVDGGGELLQTIATVSGFPGDVYSLYWSKYIKVGEQWYVADAPFYQGEITAEGTKEVTYTPSEIAYFIECEKMYGVRSDRIVTETNANNSGYYKVRINNYYPTIWTDVFEEGGRFDLTLPYNNSNSSNHTYQIRTRDANGTLSDVIAEWTCANGSQVYTLKDITIPAGSSLAISCDGISGNSNARMDYLTLTPHYNSYTVQTNEGIVIASGSCKDGEDYSVVLPEVVADGGKFYVLSDESVVNYTKTFTMATDGEVQTINYTEDPTIVYYTEGDDNGYMEQVEAEGYSAGNYKANPSGNYGNTRNRGSNVGNLPAGQYEITARLISSGKDRAICVRTTKTGDNNSGNAPLLTLRGEGIKAGEFALGSEKTIVLTGDNDGTTGAKSLAMQNFDYIIIRKTSDVAAEIVNVTDAGYATYYSENPLDFTGTGLTAYIAEVNGSAVSFTEVTSVPAKTGVLVKGDKGAYTVNVVSSSTDVSTNAFVGVLDYTKVENTGIYVLMNGANGVGFYKTTADAFTVSARTAYLPATVASGRAFIGFDDETTGIKTVSNAAENNGMIFNLNGQRVSSPKGGLYIKNGKKVIIK